MSSAPPRKREDKGQMPKGPPKGKLVPQVEGKVRHESKGGQKSGRGREDGWLP